MLFSVRVSQCGSEWEIQGVRGELAGVVVAVAEAVYMGVTHINKDGEVLTGRIHAVWGAVINDDMTTRLDVMRGLGIGYRRMPRTVGALMRQTTGGGVGWIRRPARSEKVILRTNGRAFEEGQSLKIV